MSAIYAVINMIISVLIGFILAKLGILTPTTRGVVSSVNYYALVPIYGLMYIMKAIDRNSLTELGFVLFSSISSVIVAFIVTLTIVFAIGADVRYRFAYTFIVVYQNIVVMPQMLAESLCAKGGKYETSLTCKNSLVKPYCALPFIYVNIAYWVTVLPVLQNEKSISCEMRKIFAVVLNYYEKIDDFLADSDFSKRKSLKLGEKPSQDATPALAGVEAKADRCGDILTTEAALFMKDDKFMPLKTDDSRFLDEYYNRTITKGDYNNIMAQYAKFEETVLNAPDQTANKEIIYETILKPEKLLEPPVREDILSLDFYKRRILFSPPALWSIIGVILGFIFPFKEWFYEPTRKPLPTFISTLETVGGMMSPISLFLLGSYIAQSAVISRDLFIRWKHVIVSNLVRNLIMPLIGLLWICVFVKGMNESLYINNPVLIFIKYSYWIVPNGVVLISVYVVADYFAKEFAVLSVYLNLVAVPMMAVYIFVYFKIYEA
ncbi:MAG: AEC family transporter [Candidatus Pacebacteria bacterium]|nr:AEC family transporter [Candidatus Paceibacterota bacterium]